MTTDIRDLSQAKRLVTQLKSRIAELEAKLSTQTAEPYGYVLKTGHGTAFRENLAGVEPDFVKHWVRVFTHPAKTEQPSLSDEREEDEYVIDRLSMILAGVSIAFKGEELPLHRHSYHDLAELAKAKMLEIDLLNHQIAELSAAQRQDSDKDAERFRWIEENCHTEGGGKGFTIFVPVDHEDIGCGIDQAIANGAPK